ncbi:hypothetical protein BLNAU_23639 [Blattamonas nauphoetae]|uniref:Uncharacterized protein n=1 Tax=Blattamonas nauphoetae TaxID=2049346 RepID=A0ABQ9WPQ0_9EUKA|nr:hypothetical protein BLNAU_23639 [Blattamonas nauphoetae]
MRDEIMNKKKKSRGVGPNEQKVHLAVSMLDIRNEWNVLNIFIQLGSERGDATFVGYDLSISTSMTSLKSLANSYCLTTLVSSFKVHVPHPLLRITRNHPRVHLYTTFPFSSSRRV